TDMLAAMEDLLDTWPGPLIVVSHDRYLLERVTDTQYAVLDGTVRHVPGGVEQYLQLRRQQDQRDRRESSAGAGSRHEASTGASSDGALTGADAHATRKELSSIERRMDRVSSRVDGVHERLAAHDQSDYQGLQEITGQLRDLETELEGLEERWLELSELLG